MKGHTKLVLILLAILIVSSAVAFVMPGFFPLGDVELYLTVTGLTYGLLAAFAIGVAWERYNNIVAALQEELGSMQNVHEMLKHVSDKQTARELNQQLITYCKAAITTPWDKYFKADETHRKFRRLSDILYKMKIKNSKDDSIVSSCHDELREAATATTTEMVLSHIPLSKSLWLLLILLSSAVIVGVFLIEFESIILGAFTKIIMTISSVAILYVLHQIDSMELSTVENEDEPFLKFIDQINKEM